MLKVVDLFCGGGGISEGLRQAGFEIVFGLDNNKAAAETFRKNHPDADVRCSDITSVGLDEIPDSDIIVGGPPCIEFSASKQGRGDILEGLRLVQEFLRVVYWKQPRYWIMENVPRIVMHLPHEIALRSIGIDEDGSLPVPRRCELNAANFGAPQTRRRFLMGSFPEPQPTHYDPERDALLGAAEGRTPWVTLKEITRALPDPSRTHFPRRIHDPIYRFSISVERLTGHFYDTNLAKEESSRIRKAKTEHPYMGWMPFPDDVNSPARTVVATQLGRETLVLESGEGNAKHYRRATVRECASLQTFPISYQFFGQSWNARYRIVGDAVPPRMAYAVGKSILQDAGYEHAEPPILRKRVTDLARTPISTRLSPRRPTYRIDRRFSEQIPGKEVRGCRAELDNRGNQPHTVQAVEGEHRHLVEWSARLHVGEGRGRATSTPIPLRVAVQELSGYCTDEARTQLIEGLLSDLQIELSSSVPDASTLQAVWAARHSGPDGPEAVVDRASDVINRWLPRERFSNVCIFRSGHIPEAPKKGLRVRIAAGLVAAAYIADLSNHDANWPTHNISQRWLADGWAAHQHSPVGRHEVHIPGPADVLADLIQNRPDSTGTDLSQRAESA